MIIISIEQNYNTTNLEKRMNQEEKEVDQEPRMNRRSFLKAAGTTLSAIVLGVLGLPGCVSNKGNERIDKYLRDVYQNADLNQISDDTFRGSIEDYRNFIKQYMPYVKIDNPSKRDEAFLSQIRDINIVESYMTIDPTNFTEQQRNDLAEFNALILTENDREYISSIPWMNPNKLTDKDKIWLIENARATAEAYLLHLLHK